MTISTPDPLTLVSSELTAWRRRQRRAVRRTALILLSITLAIHIAFLLSGVIGR